MALAEATRIDDAGLERARRRAMWLLVIGAALGSTAVVAATTVVVIAADELLDDSLLVGASASTLILGAALGTSLLAAVITRRGRRVGLATGYAAGLLGSLLAAGAVLAGIFPLLLAGSLLIGFANSATLLSRYASAVMAESERRASAIGSVVWASTAGAILGPVLVPVTAGLADTLGTAELVGPFLAAGITAGAAALILTWKLRPDPDELAVPEDRAPQGDEEAATAGLDLRAIVRRPPVAVAIVAMVVGQVVMIVIMAMTPLHMTHHGHGLSAIAVVISAHVLGMYLLSPVSGRIADRIGAVRTILLGVAVLAVAALLAAATPGEGGMLLVAALFLLGYGWNLGFVAGSALLTSGLEPWERTRAQGYADTLVWTSSAVGSLSSGLILAVAGYAALGLASALLLILPVLAIVAWRPRPTSPITAS